MKNMDFVGDYIVLPFIKAWNLFFKVQIPENKFYYSHVETDESHVLYFIPVVGMVIGIITYLFSYITYFSGGSVIAAILCPFIIIIFTEYLNYSEDSSNLVNFITTKYAHYYKEPTEEIHHQQNKMMFYYVFIGIFILRLLAMGALIYYQRFSWLIVMFVLIFSIQGYLATKADFNLNRFDLLHAGKNPGVKIWIIVFVLCLIFGGVYMFSMLLTFIISALVGYKAKQLMTRNNTLNGINIGILGKVMEIVILFLGLLYRLH